MATPEERRSQLREATLEAELLDRLERQVAELTELKARVKALEGSVEAERKTRAQMSERLTTERERVKKLQHDLQHLGADEEEVAVLRQELARERQSSVTLGSQLEQAWTQLNDLRAAHGAKSGLFRRNKR